MVKNYDLLLLVLKKWPVDKSKGTRCFGFHIRQLAKNGFPSGNIFGDDVEENHSKLSALLRLSENCYGKKYSYNIRRGASGFELANIQKYLSDDFVDVHLKRIPVSEH